MMPMVDISSFILTMSVFVFAAFYHAYRQKRPRSSGIMSLTVSLVVNDLNPAMLMCYASLSFQAGPWAITLPLTLLIALSFYALCIAKNYREHHAASMKELFAGKYGSLAAQVLGLGLIAATLFLASAIIRSFALLYADFFHINIFSASLILITASFIIPHKANIDYIFVILFIIFIFFLILRFRSDLVYTPVPVRDGRTILPPELVLSLILLFSLSYVCAPWHTHKISQAKNAKIAATSSAIAAVVVFMFYAFLTLAANTIPRQGMASKIFEYPLSYILSARIPLGLRGLAYSLIAILAFITLARLWHAISNLKEATPLRLPLIFYALLSLLIANLFNGNIFTLFIMAHLCLFALSFAGLAALFGPVTNRAAALTSTAIGLVWSLCCFIFFGEQSSYISYAIVLGLPLIFSCGLVLSLWGRKKLTKSESSPL